MTIGVGGSTPESELAAIGDLTRGVEPIPLAEYRSRIERACELMAAEQLDAIFICAGTNLYYFTGTRWTPSERLVGAVLTRGGELHYLAPAFELGTLRDYIQVGGTVHCWEEHESPYALLDGVLRQLGVDGSDVGIDESTPFFVYDGLRTASPHNRYRSATAVTAGCRMHKSAAELALLQAAKDLTLQVHRHAARILAPGITAAEVTDFIHRAHLAAGAPAGSYFCIVLFGEDTAYPHGVARPKALEEGDMVLIDTGCQLHGYNSDITRSYVFGTPSQSQRDAWNVEREAQAAAFAAARPGVRCGAVDEAARAVLEKHGYGPGYALPGLPHRTGHGIGLDIHEWPYLVLDNPVPLAPGMCFSNEPMLCIPGEFGIRLEDHFYVTDDGPRWFTTPSPSIDDPFAGIAD